MRLERGFVSFSNFERYKDIGIDNPTGHFLLKGYDQLGLWLEHPGIVIIHGKDESGAPLPVKDQTKEDIAANFVVTWDNVNTIMHYPERDGYDFPSEFEKMKLPSLDDENTEETGKIRNIKELIDEFMDKRESLKELEEELKKNKDKITPGQIGEA